MTELRNRNNGGGAAEDAATKGTPPAAARCATTDRAVSSSAPADTRCKRCLKFCATASSVLLVFSAIAVAILYGFYYEESQLFLMRFFRDLARTKAHARLHGQSQALMMVLTGNEEILPMVDVAEDGLAITAEELRAFDGTDGAPLYLAIMGRVYDVSKGQSFYGKGRSYHLYVGKDATRSFATGCTKEECLVPSLVGCSEQQKQEAMRWLELYEHHDRYTFIGRVRADPVADLVEKELMEEKVLEAAREAEAEYAADPSSGESRVTAAQRMSERAAAKYGGQDRNLDEAVSYWKSSLLLLGEASPGDSPETVLARADVLVSMAAAVQKQRDFAQANEYYQEAQDGMETALGVSTARAHPTYARAVSDQAASIYMGKSAEEAVTGFERALACYGEALAASGDQSVGDENGRWPRTEVEAANTQLNLGTALLDAADAAQDAPDSERRTRAENLLTELTQKYSSVTSDARLKAITEAAVRLLAPEPPAAT